MAATARGPKQKKRCLRRQFRARMCSGSVVEGSAAKMRSNIGTDNEAIEASVSPCSITRNVPTSRSWAFCFYTRALPQFIRLLIKYELGQFLCSAMKSWRGNRQSRHPQDGSENIERSMLVSRRLSFLRCDSGFFGSNVSLPKNRPAPSVLSASRGVLTDKSSIAAR